jgi:adenylate kinase
MQVIILGPPGVGKGTQSLLISQKLGLIHLSTGEILRSAVEAKTALGLQAQEIMNSGKLVSDEIMVGIVKDALSVQEMKTNGFILDGFPRTLNQAIELDKIFREFGFEDVRIINIIADQEVLINRLMGRGRPDDTLETVTNRLKVYKEQTAPVREYYSKEYPVHDINGVGNIDDINNGIVDVLKNAATNA